MNQPETVHWLAFPALNRAFVRRANADFRRKSRIPIIPGSSTGRCTRGIREAGCVKKHGSTNPENIRGGSYHPRELLCELLLNLPLLTAARWFAD
jgi:hypothetical protein